MLPLSVILFLLAFAVLIAGPVAGAYLWGERLDRNPKSAIRDPQSE